MAARPKILIVEDEPLYLEVVAELFEEHGYEVVTATSVADGLQKALNGPNVILMDVTLPDATGWQALERLKADPRTSDIPVVMQTGHSIEHADRVRAAAVLMKPIRSVDLVAAVERVRR